MSQKINFLEYHKQAGESEFRVHFYLRNVFYSSEKRLQTFLDETASRISQTVPVALIQVYGTIKKYLDLSVGLKSDKVAILFRDSGRNLYLPGDHKKVIDHEPIFSEAFLVFYRKYHESVQLDPLLKIPSPIHTEAIVKNNSLSESRSPHIEDRKMIRQNSGSIRSEREAPRYRSLFIFCVPLEFKEKDVCRVLNSHKIKVRYVEWRMREDIQYLFAELLESLTEADIMALDVSMEKYPILITTKFEDESVSELVHRHEVELNFKQSIDEIELMHLGGWIGGVVSMVKDDFYGPHKYVVAFNTMSRLRRFKQQVQKRYKGVMMGRPKYPIRLSRLQKHFNFVHMLDNLTQFERDLQKIKISTGQ